MMKFFVKRVAQGLVVIFILETLTFFLVRALPGNPFLGERKLPPHVLEQLNSLYGLDAGMGVQFLRYWKAILLHGDFGPSLVREGVQVSELLAQAFPVSLQLGTAAMLFAVLVGVPAGMFSAYRRNRWPDTLFMLIAVAGICIPSFVLAPVLGITLGAHVPGLSVAGWDNPLCILLPTLALGAVNAAYIARLSRAGMIETLSSDFVRTAKAKGAGSSRILWLHALRCGLLPVVSYMGPAFAALITGSFVVESCFQVPGLGLHFVNATTDRDYFLIQGLVFCYGVLIVCANLAVDLCLAWLNPRLRSS